MISAFDRAALQKLRPELEAALVAVAAKHGITAKVGSCTFSPAEAKFKLIVTTAGVDHEKAEAERQLFVDMAPAYGLKPEWFGGVCEINRKPYKIVGIKPQSRSYPVICERIDGKRFKFPTYAITAAFARQEASR